MLKETKTKSNKKKEVIKIKTNLSKLIDTTSNTIDTKKYCFNNLKTDFLKVCRQTHPLLRKSCCRFGQTAFG